MIDKILLSEPVNRISSLITSQSRCSKDCFLDRKSAIDVLDKLKQRQKELKEIAGIKRKSQLVNLKHNRMVSTSKKIDKNIVCMLLENGIRIQELENHISTLR